MKNFSACGKGAHIDDERIVEMLRAGAEGGLALLIGQYRGLATAIIRKILPGHAQMLKNALRIRLSPSGNIKTALTRAMAN